MYYLYEFLSFEMESIERATRQARHFSVATVTVTGSCHMSKLNQDVIAWELFNFHQLHRLYKVKTINENSHIFPIQRI